MSNAHESQKEIRRILRLLETTARLIETSTITDEFSGGEERCVQQFNNALARLSNLEAVPNGLFEPLESGAAFGDICFACHQISAYLKDGLADDFDFAQVKKTIGDELKDVGEVVRQSMPSFFKDVWGSAAEETDAAKPETVEVTSEENGEGETAGSVEERIAKLEGQMETVVEILQELRAQQVEQNPKL